MSYSSEIAVRVAAERIFAARAENSAIAPIRGAFRPHDVDAAYAIQRLNVVRMIEQGYRRVGRKIGLTSRAVQTQLGVDQPDHGVLFDMMDCSETFVSLKCLIEPRIEAEIAFRIARTIDRRGLSREDLISHIDGVASAAEVVDSAIEGWDIRIVDTIADNASSGRFVVGPWHNYKASSDLTSAKMRMEFDGQIVSSGHGAATLGDPVNALAWLADISVEKGDPLSAGEIVLAGALGPMTPLNIGQYTVSIDGFPRLTVEVKP